METTAHLDSSYNDVDQNSDPPPSETYNNIKLGEEASVTRSTKIFCFCAALNSCNLGYDIGVSAVVSPLLKESDLALSDVRLELFIGSLNLFAMVGAFFAIQISDRFGRRKSFTAAAIGFIIGRFIMACAQNYATLMVGRAFVGLGVGFGLAIDPLYIAEIAPEAHRGRLVTWSELAINIGIAFGFSMGLVFKNVDKNLAWRIVIAQGSFLSLCVILSSLTVMPESPRWLISKGFVSEGKDVLRIIYPQSFHVEKIVGEIQTSITEEAEVHRNGSCSAILSPTPTVRRMLLVGFGSAIAQQLSGIDSIQYFMLFLFEKAGINDDTKYYSLFFMGLIKVLFVYLGGQLLDVHGRRPLLKSSLAGMVVALLVIAFAFFLKVPLLGIFGVGLYLAMYSVGLGPGAWLVPSEVFAISIRARAMSIATLLNRTTSFILTSTFLSLANNVGYGGYFIINAVVCIFIFGFYHLYLPETKGKTLEEMSLYFAEITRDKQFLDVDQRVRKEAKDTEDIRQEVVGGIIT